MKKDRDLYNLIKSKVDEPTPLDDFDWMQIQKKSKASSWLTFKWFSFNIYYVAFILSGSAIAWAYYSFYAYDDATNTVAKCKSMPLQQENIQQEKQQSNILDQVIDVINEKVSSKPIQENLFNGPKNNNTTLEKTAPIKPEETYLTENNIILLLIPNVKDSVIPEKIIEKKPVIIELQDTIYDVDSTKVSRHKLKKMK